MALRQQIARHEARVLATWHARAEISDRFNLTRTHRNTRRVINSAVKQIPVLKSGWRGVRISASIFPPDDDTRPRFSKSRTGN